MRHLALWCLALLWAVVAGGALASDVVYDGRRYIDVPLQLGSDTVLNFPEDVSWSAEQPSRFEIRPFGTGFRSLIVRPLAEQEQRVFFRGNASGQIYLARFATSGSYLPIVTVRSGAAVAEEQYRSAAKVSIPGLLRSMMGGGAAGGFEKVVTNRVLLQQAPLLITAREVWASPQLVGIIVELQLTGAAPTVELRPAGIRIDIPDLGTLRAFSADAWELTAARPSTRGYLVFSR
jgi:hypothetical protein